ncbi:MAG: FAD-binding and (Fe-S)-binding domain-containing protein [Actinomycetota bacterium]
MGLTRAQRSFLQTRFANRVNFDPVERRLYGHDIGALPHLVRPLVGRTTPDAVVQPESEEELVELARWAFHQGVPMTPRARASSGYGGAVPVKGGLVVDFYRMAGVESVDRDGLTATVQPGITWEKLDRELAAEGLTLRLYPSSYPSSTVGGWLAQGGAGFGSFEFGFFRDNVVSAHVVLPGGETRVFEGDDLELVSEAEGTTGLISGVTLRVMPGSELGLAGYAFERASDLQAFIEKVIAADLPVWSFMFVNPRMAGMRNRAADLSGHGNGEEAVRLPEAYLAILTFRAQDAEAVEGGLEEAAPAGAARLSPQITAHEWEDRFKIMLVKRLGPSLVPAEVVVPVSGLAGAMDEMESRVHHPVLKEGIVVRRGSGGRPEVVLLGFIPGDERTLGYNLMFALSLSIMRIAGKYGGRLYGTGMYFASMADDILGRAKADRLRRFTAEVDPGGIMNPGKVTDAGALSRLLKLAALFEPLARPLGNLVASRVGERPGGEKRGIPGDVAWYAYSCSQCGYCVDVCDQFYGRGWESQSPRGKWYWLREYLEGRAKWDQSMVDTFLVCTTCEACDTRCGAGLPIETSWMKLRGALIERDGRMTFPPFEMMAAALRAEGDIWAGYRSDRANWFPEDLADRHGPGVKAPAVYFAGCTASYVEHDIAMATARLLDEAGVEFTYLGEEESCCGTPMLVAGKWEVFVEVMKCNIAAVKASGADTVISSCPACDMMWRHTYPEWCGKLGIDYGITARHYSEVVAERLADGTFAFPRGAGAETVTWHDSCHIGRASGVYDEPRALIEAVPGTRLVEMEHNREEALCCGSVLTLIKEPPVAAEIGEVRLAEAEAAGADKVLALCPCCQFQLRVSADKKGYDTEVVDLARYCASALGYEFPDPNPEVAAQWAVFEAMIELMTPRGFADLMGTMWPELIDAMPLGMGRMMRLMGKVPFALSAMKPMFPVLFPRLLPLMMPKVMPVMLQRVAERIPMPDYMAEQMPELMPKVMDNLMPHMIRDVVPLVTDPMIEYLKSGGA